MPLPSVIRQPSIHDRFDREKRILYNAGAIQVESDIAGNKFVCLVAELISSTHDTTLIANWLLKFKSYWLKFKNSWLTFDRVVTYFSLAEIHAICNSLNKQPLLVYINNYCDDLAYQKGSISNCITPIQLCCAHMMNIFSSLVNEHFKETNIRTILKETLVTLTTMSNIHEVETFFEYFTILLDSKFKFISRKRGEI